MQNDILVQGKKGHFCLYTKYENKCIWTQHLAYTRQQSTVLLQELAVSSLALLLEGCSVCTQQLRHSTEHQSSVEQESGQYVSQ